MSDPGSTAQLPAVKADPAKGSGLTLGFLLLLASPVLLFSALNQPFLNLDGASELAAITAKTEGPRHSLTPLSDAVLRVQLGITANPALARLINLLFHFGSAMLLYGILRGLMPVSGVNVVGPGFTIISSLRLTKSHLAAGLAVAWFFFHPTNVESISLASQRANVQALFFCLLAWWALIKPMTGAALGAFLEPPDIARFLLSLVAFVAAIYSNAAAVAFTPVLLLTEWILVRGPAPGRMIRGGMLGATGVLLGVKILAMIPAQELAGASGLTVLASLGHGIQLLLVPWPLSYEYVTPDPVGLGDPAILMGVGLVLLLIALLALLPVEPRRLLVLITGMLTAMGFSIWLRGKDGFQDHRVYLALPCAAAMLALAIEALQYRCVFVVEAAQLGVRRFSFFIGIVGCLFLGWLAFSRSAVFADGEALYRDAVEHQPDSYRANAGLAKLLLANGKATLAHSATEAPKLLDEAGKSAVAALKAADKDAAPNTAEMRYVEACVAFLLERADARDKANLVAEMPGQGIAAEKAGALRILADLSRKEYAATKDPKKLEDSAKALQQLLALRKDDGEARLARAEALEVLGRKLEAIEELKMVTSDASVGARAKEALGRLEQTPKTETVPVAVVTDPALLPKPAAPIKPNEARVALVILLKQSSGKLKEQGLQNLLQGDLVTEADGSFSFGNWKCDPQGATFTAAIPDGEGALKISGIFRTRSDHLRAFILGDKQN